MVFGRGDEIIFSPNRAEKIFGSAWNFSKGACFDLRAACGAQCPRSSFNHMHTLIAPLALVSLEGLGAMALYALVGTGLAIVGYKLFDRATPGDLHEEIVKNRNTAAAIVGAAVILGVCLIVAAAIVG
jgi:putative membrane protein